MGTGTSVQDCMLFTDRAAKRKYRLGSRLDPVAVGLQLTERLIFYKLSHTSCILP